MKMRMILAFCLGFCACSAVETPEELEASAVQALSERLGPTTNKELDCNYGPNCTVCCAGKICCISCAGTGTTCP